MECVVSPLLVISSLFREGRSTLYSTKKWGSFLAYSTLAIEIHIAL